MIRGLSYFGFYGGRTAPCDDTMQAGTTVTGIHVFTVQSAPAAHRA